MHPFHVSRYPITNAQFQAFLDDPDGSSNERWWLNFEAHSKEVSIPNQTGENHPRDGVSWHQAMAFALWIEHRLPLEQRPYVENSSDWEIRLPHEWEWQWAAIGPRQTMDFPWGAWDASKTNLKEAGIGRTVAVGLYPASKGYGGALDMIGNLRQWCVNVYKAPDELELGGKRPRVLRGGSIYQDHVHSTARYRASNAPTHSSREAGFRLVYAPKLRLLINPPL